MSDSIFDTARLPGPPNAGYSTRKEKLASDFIQEWMRMTERNRTLLLTVVTQGLSEWRRIARPRYRPFGIDDETIDEIYRTLVVWAGPNPEEQLLTLHEQMRIQEIVRYDRRRITRMALNDGLQSLVKDMRRERRKTRH